MNRAATLEEYHLENAFTQLRNRLRHDPKLKDRLDKPLAFWAIRADKRLPFALLGCTLGNILGRDFADLAATPGVGVKKISALLMLLERAASEPAVTMDFSPPVKQKTAKSEPVASEAFDPNTVSESQWSGWRKAVRAHKLGDLKIGRIAASLTQVPTVVWHTRLSRYLDMTLDEIRKLKTYGDKRVRVVLECFRDLHAVVGQVEPLDHLLITFEPTFTRELGAWLTSAVTSDGKAPSFEEIVQHFAKPVAKQIRLDLGDVVGDLVDGRLGLAGTAEPVREQSEELGVTRARVYQLFEDCAKASAVRWPEGRLLVREFAKRYDSMPRKNRAKDLVQKLSDLLFPAKFDNVDFSE